MSAPARIAYSVRDAAEVAGVSTQLILRAIKSQGRQGEPPHLPAKFLGGRAGYRVKHSHLESWVDKFPDA